MEKLNVDVCLRCKHSFQHGNSIGCKLIIAWIFRRYSVKEPWEFASNKRLGLFERNCPDFYIHLVLGE